MKLIERLGLAALHKFDPETSHGLSITALKSGLAPLSGQVTSSRLATTIAGLDLPNPIGLAAGYDKNARSDRAPGQGGFWIYRSGCCHTTSPTRKPKAAIVSIDPRSGRDQSVWV